MKVDDSDIGHRERIQKMHSHKMEIITLVKGCPIGKIIAQSGHTAFAPYSANMDNLIFHYRELQLLIPYNIVA